MRARRTSRYRTAEIPGARAGPHPNVRAITRRARGIRSKSPQICTPTRPRTQKGLANIPASPSLRAIYSAASASRSRVAASLGVLPTLTPAASRASFLPWAVPAPSETMAPAWPMVLPSGAVNPAT